MRPCTWSVLFVFIFGGFSSLAAETITVSQTGTADDQCIMVSQRITVDFQCIEAAILLASAGDTIRVAAGTYYVSGFSILTERITLLGAGSDSTIISYSWPHSIFIAADSVTIEGFTFDYDPDGSSAAAQSSAMSIWSQGGDLIRPLVRGNRFIVGYAAIVLHSDTQPIIQYNQFLTRYSDPFEYMGLILVENSNNIDARYNWWGTDDRTLIQGRIRDGQDEDGLGIVDFDPWLSKPGGSIRTAVERLSWGNLKRIHLSK